MLGTFLADHIPIMLKWTKSDKSEIRKLAYCTLSASISGTSSVKMIPVKYPTLFVNDDVYLTPSTEDFNKIMQDLKLRA